MTEDDDNVVHLRPRDDEPSRSRIANPLSLRTELQHHAATKGLVGFDEFAQAVMMLRPIPRPRLRSPKCFEPRPWQDADDTALIEHLNHRGFPRVGRGLVRDVIELEARSNPFHPVQTYLQSLTWDGVKRLDQFLLDLCGAVIEGDSVEERRDHQRYLQAVTRCFFISAVARIMQPGCKVDSTLILEGSQGALKSSLLRAVAVRDEWFSDSLPHDLASKDARQHLAGVWIVELSEIAQFRRSEIESVKDYLSCQIDRFRPPYGRSDVAVPRQNIFVGSTNADIYLHDSTGNRRFWPVQVTTIRLVDVRPIVDQLWAEAFGAWRNKEKWWLADDVEKIAAEQQDGRLGQDPWFDDIVRFVNSRLPDEWITTADALKHLDIDVGRRDRGHEMRVGAMLRQLGCERKKRRDETTGKPRWSYRTPPAADGFDGASEAESL